MIKTLPDVFKATAEKYANHPSFMTRTSLKGPYDGPTWSELHEMALNLGTALAKLGLNPKDHVGLLADNCLEWILCDMAVLMNGAADVPRGTDVTDDEIVYILNHSESTFLILQNEKMLKRVLKLKDQLSSIKTIIVMDKAFSETEEVRNIYSLVEEGSKLRKEGDSEIEKRMENIQESDLFTIIYTSGTTGTPKGVMLTHANMVSQVRTLKPLVKLKLEDKALSILPIWHVFERVVEYLFISAGGQTFYTTIRTIVADLSDVQPTIMGSAPRLWEMVYQKMMAKIDKSPTVAKMLIKTSLFALSQVNQAKRFFNGTLRYLEKPTFMDRFNGFFVHAFCFLLWILPATLLSFVPKKLRAVTGNQLRGTISGGGALPSHIDLFFNDIGIPVWEGYGMTETSPVISVRPPEHIVIGAVGGPIPETEVEIRDVNDLEKKLPQGSSGVIHIKGPQVMQGYYKNPEATSAVLKDGWMNTGDIGMINFNDAITITGRAKDTVVLLSGENVEPVPIENKMLCSPYISQTMVVGQDQKFLGALVVADEDTLVDWAKNNGLPEMGFDDLLINEKVSDLIRGEIQTQINSRNGFKSFERIGGFRILQKPFEVGDELNSTFKLKRHVVSDKYKDLIGQIYN